MRDTHTITLEISTGAGQNFDVIFDDEWCGVSIGHVVGFLYGWAAANGLSVIVESSYHTEKYGRLTGNGDTVRYHIEQI